MTDPPSIIGEPSVPPRTRRIALIGGGGVVFLHLVYLFVFLPRGIVRVEASSSPLLTVAVVLTFLALFYVWIQAFKLIFRDTLLLERHRTRWIIALVFLGPAAGVAFILWYARRTAG